MSVVKVRDQTHTNGENVSPSCRRDLRDPAFLCTLRSIRPSLRNAEAAVFSECRLNPAMVLKLLSNFKILIQH